MMITGIFFALGAGLLWRMIFVDPLLVPDYPGVLQSAARHVAFGLIALRFGMLPLVFVPLIIAIGLLCSWFGAFCWNEATQRLPMVLVGPLIVFETLAGLTYTFCCDRHGRPILSLSGIIFLNHQRRRCGGQYQIAVGEKIVSL